VFLVYLPPKKTEAPESHLIRCYLPCIAGLPGVLFVLPDSYVDPEYKDYGGSFLNHLLGQVATLYACVWGWQLRAFVIDWI
jgi:hypothetical protein